MITNFKNHRNPDTSLTWDDRYPETYVYQRSAAIANLIRRAEERRKPK